MSTTQLTKDWRFFQLVKIAIIRRLTYKEAVVFIEKNGHPKISERTYQRAKMELKASQHLKDIAIEGFAEYSLDIITTTAAIDAELWEVVRNTKDPWVRLKAIKMIMENCPKKSEDFESGKALSYVSNELEAAKSKKKNIVESENIVVEEEDNVEENLESGSN